MISGGIKSLLFLQICLNMIPKNVQQNIDKFFNIPVSERVQQNSRYLLTLPT